MINEPNPITELELDAYLDGLMEPATREAFEARLHAQPEIAKKVHFFCQLDDSAKRLFPPEYAAENQVGELLAHRSIPTDSTPEKRLPSRSLSGRMLAVMVGLAAALAWIIVAWQMGDDSRETPFFEPQPVALVYQEVVDNGFEPYYECRDDERFAATFLRRQGKALTLATLPQGSQMLGLSYAGGLSRDTTAMLCKVDGQSVMVFVDQIANDLPIASKNSASTMKVHRVARDGLVFYEVTPFDDARVIEFLVPQEVDSSSS